MSCLSFFPKPQEVCWSDRDFEINEETAIVVAGVAKPEILQEAERLNGRIAEAYGLKLEVLADKHISASRKRIVIGLLRDSYIEETLSAKGLSVPPKCREPEGYLLFVDAASILLAGGDVRGLFYGMQTLLQLTQQTDDYVSVKGARVVDYPYKPIRGVHIFLPSRENIAFYKRLVHLLASYKYNTIFIEVGGGMHYSRHPEINVAWIEFCNVANAHPGGPIGLERSQGFSKDSSHTELAGGSFLEKEEVKALVDYARGYHMNVIPEVQSLSHGYYLTVPHKEIAERLEDPWPDTYCPSNPKSYELLFDVIDEVVDVFEPNYIHIGHDEVYSLRLCPQCKKKTGAELFAGDVTKIHNYLAARGIKTAMWGDKFLSITMPNGKKIGGVTRRPFDPVHKRRWVMPRTYPAVDMVPKDILILDWYWSMEQNPDTQDFFLGKGFKEIFGNFNGLSFNDFPSMNGWMERSSKPNVLGAEVSTWGAVDEYELGRNGNIFVFLFSIQMLWNSYYDESQREDVISKVAQLAPKVRDILGSRNSPSIARFEKSFETVDLTQFCNSNLQDGFDLSQLPLGPVKFRGIPFHIVDPTIKTGKACLAVGGKQPAKASGITVMQRADSLIFLHTCNMERTFRPTYSEPEYMQKDIIGNYYVRYVDGSVERVPIKYGINITRWNAEYPKEPGSICYFTDPVWRGKSAGGGPAIVYAYEWINPKSDVAIKTIDLETVDPAAGEIVLLACTAMVQFGPRRA